MVCSDVALKKVSKRPRWKTNQIRIELETSEDAFGTVLVRDEQYMNQTEDRGWRGGDKSLVNFRIWRMNRRAENERKTQVSSLCDSNDNGDNQDRKDGETNRFGGRENEFTKKVL